MFEGHSHFIPTPISSFVCLYPRFLYPHYFNLFPSRLLSIWSVIHHCLWSLMWAHLCFSTKCMNRGTVPSLDVFSFFRNPHRALDASWGRGTGTTVVDTKGTIGYMLMQLTYALWSHLISVLEPTLHPTVDYCQIHWSHNLVGLIGPSSWWEVPNAWSFMSPGQASVLPGLRSMTGVVFKKVHNSLQQMAMSCFRIPGCCNVILPQTPCSIFPHHWYFWHQRSIVQLVRPLVPQFGSSKELSPTSGLTQSW